MIRLANKDYPSFAQPLPTFTGTIYAHRPDESVEMFTRLLNLDGLPGEIQQLENTATGLVAFLRNGSPKRVTLLDTTGWPKTPDLVWVKKIPVTLTNVDGIISGKFVYLAHS